MPVCRRGTLMIQTGPTEHLHIVMNDPVFSPEDSQHAVLVVNVSSVQPKVIHDPACVLVAGCHPFITRDSFVFYAMATVSNSDRITQQIQSGDIRMHDHVSETVFRLVADGFSISQFVKPKIARFIKNYIGGF